MSMFKRAEWHSGLTYQAVCEQCKAVVTYKDNVLDFRPWYPDGFVYCPRCNQPIRHSERFAINGMPEANIDLTNTLYNQPVTNGEKPLFCTKCGKRFEENDAFCSSCGNRR